MKHILAGSNGTNRHPIPMPSLLDGVAATEIKNAAALHLLGGSILKVGTTNGDGLFLLLDGEPVDPFYDEVDNPRWTGAEYYTHRASEIFHYDVWDALADGDISFPDEAFTWPDINGILRRYPAAPRQWRVLHNGEPARLWIAEEDLWQIL